MCCCNSARKSRAATSLIELLVVFLIIALTVAILLPSVQYARVSANRAQSQNNLKQMGLAVVNMAVTNNGVLPQSAGSYSNVTAGSATLFYWMLPYVEEGNVYALGNANLPDDAVVKTYVAVTDPTAAVGVACTSYASNSLVFTATPVTPSAVPVLPRFQAVYYPVSFSDGTSSTIILAERYAQGYSTPTTGVGAQAVSSAVTHYWSKPTALTTYVTPTATSGVQFAPSSLEANNALPQGMTPNGINIALADGSVRFVNSSISATTWYEACTIDGGETLGTDW